MTWLDNTTYETGFRLERSTNSGASYSLAAQLPLAAGSGTTLSFTDKALTPGTTYTYRVKAANGAGSAYNTNGPQSATTTSAPAAPSALAATALSATKVNLAWTDNASDEQGFKLERSDDGGATWPKMTIIGPSAGTGSSVTFVNTKLTPGSTYTYRVRAFNDGANSELNTNGNQAATTMSVPAAPGDLAVTPIAPNKIQVSWTDNSTTEQGFRLERSKDGGATWNRDWFVAPVAGSGTTATFVNSDLIAGVTYTYRIRAINDTTFSAYNANGPQSATAVGP